MSFKLEQPRNFADDEIAGSDAEPGAKLHVVIGGKEWFEFKTAEYFCILFRPADTGGQMLIFHGVSNDDEMAGNARGKFFSRAKGEICPRALKRPKRRSVNGVNNDRDTGAFCRQAAQESPFGAVSVDNVRPL